MFFFLFNYYFYYVNYSIYNLISSLFDKLNFSDFPIQAFYLIAKHTSIYLFPRYLDFKWIALFFASNWTQNP